MRGNQYERLGLSNSATDDRDNVCTKVVKQEMCVGCGTCAGMCPVNCLKIRTNKYGEYVACLHGDCVECGLCLNVCPFYDSEINEDTIGQNRFGRIPRIFHTSETGFYQKCYAGKIHSEELLLSRSSGGLASWFLAELLKQGHVDCIACVLPNRDSKKLYRFALITEPHEIWNTAKSCYYPVEMSEVLRTVRRENLRCGFIALPCFLKGLCKAMDSDEKLAERITVLAGLVCSHLKSKYFAEYLVRTVGAHPENVNEVDFRKKTPGKPLGEYEFSCQAEEGNTKTEYTVPCDKYLWPQQLFKLNCCDYCDDFFAETADIVFMDAWLPKYANLPDGISLTIARSDLAMKLLQHGRDKGELHLESLPVDKVITSQYSGVVRKREKLAIRLALAKRKKRWFPAKRVTPNTACRRADLFRAAVAIRRNVAYKTSFVKQKQTGAGLDTFHREVSRLTRLDRLLAMACKIIRGLRRRFRNIGNKCLTLILHKPG